MDANCYESQKPAWSDGSLLSRKNELQPNLKQLQIYGMVVVHKRPRADVAAELHIGNRAITRHLSALRALCPILFTEAKGTKAQKPLPEPTAREIEFYRLAYIHNCSYVAVARLKGCSPANVSIVLKSLKRKKPGIFERSPAKKPIRLSEFHRIKQTW